MHPDYDTPPFDERSIYLRKLIVRALVGANRGHIGSAMSIVEIMRVLYDDIFTFDAKNPQLPTRDRFILSKGHGCLAWYAVLADYGFFAKEELDRFCTHDAMLAGEPDSAKVPGVEFSTGALGHGPSLGVGMAKAAKIKGEKHGVFVIVGDGETQEGAIWEAAISAATNKLDNLTIIVDHNKIQSCTFVHDTCDMGSFVKKFESFGFAAHEVDGHNVKALQDVFKKLPFETGKPNVVIAHTVKGKGIDAAEDNPFWHHKNSMLEAEMEAFKPYLDGGVS